MSAWGEGLTKNIETLQQPMPDLLSEYGSEQISLYGVTGTPEELIKMCPVPHENMTIEAKNMFLVMAMNESEVMVKQEHMPYFKEVTESRGVELKVAVRQEPEHSSTKSMPAETLLDPHTSSNKEEPRETLAKTKNAVAIEARNKEQEENQHVQKEKVFGEIVDYVPEEVLIQDETTTERMDEWLAQLRLEYETYELANKIEADAEQSQVIHAEEMGEAARVRPPKIQQSYEHDELLRYSTKQETVEPESKVAVQLLKAQSEAQDFAEPSKPDASIHNTSQQSLFAHDVPVFSAKGTESATPFIEETSTTGEIEDLSAYEDLENIFASVDEDMPEEPFFYTAEISKSTVDIAPAMPRAENGKDAVETVSFNELLPGAQEFQPVEPQNLLDVIDKYIENDEALEATDKLHAKSLIIGIESKTRELEELYSSTEEISSEETDELEVSLREACNELFACLGVRQDQETLDRFIHTIIYHQKSCESVEDTVGSNRHYLHEEKRTSELKRAFFFKLSFSQIETTSLRFLGQFALKSRHLTA